ncbi:hypothetical protein MKW98_028895 [Papaver atlanticum]|uniref:RRM domain-containing protein n=1 Tax=Papaver atlanticum TaxID=357466 RepID=A0AAD4X6U5_9MAGN|nr:hypothetical protein MKW98_028895 [Papaver atlanticum]
MDPQHFGVHDHQSQRVNSPTRRTGGLTERIPPIITPYDLGLHHHVDPSFLSSFTPPPPPSPSPPYIACPGASFDPVLATGKDFGFGFGFGPFPDNGWVVVDSLPPENEESYAKGWYSDFTEESQAAGAESSQVSDVEAIRNKVTGQSESLGSIESNSHAVADECRDDSNEFSVFVANLAADVTDYVLEETFKVKYTSVKGAKVVTDRTTGHEMMRSLTEMNGQYCLTRPMCIGAASTGPATTFQSFRGTQNKSDPNKTTVDSNITEEKLRQIFSQFGELSHVKMHEGKGCGIVQFDNRACAEEAMVMLHGSQLGGSNIRLSWACSPSNEQQHAGPNQWPAASGNMYRYDGSYADYGIFLANMFSFQGCGGPGYGYQKHQQQV